MPVGLKKKEHLHSIEMQWVIFLFPSQHANVNCFPLCLILNWIEKPLSQINLEAMNHQPLVTKLLFYQPSRCITVFF